MFLEHASFAKLREVTLSYDLSPRLTDDDVPRIGQGRAPSASAARTSIRGRTIAVSIPKSRTSVTLR